MANFNLGKSVLSCDILDSLYLHYIDDIDSNTI